MLLGVRPNAPPTLPVPAGDAMTETEIIHAPIVRLEEGRDLMRRVLGQRPALMSMALMEGISPERVASAAGLDLIEMRGSVGRWASHEHAAGRIDQEAYSALMNRVFGVAGPLHGGR